MGRIAYYDSLSRKRLGDLEGFNEYTLEPLQSDLIRDTWLHERYGCDGDQQRNRTGDYFEYPSIVAMLLREVRYGINLGVGSITIDPFGMPEYSFHVGSINVDYSNTQVVVRVPGGGPSDYIITGMLPDASYVVSVEGEGCSTNAFAVSSDRSGELRFRAEMNEQCTVTANLRVSAATATA